MVCKVTPMIGTPTHRGGSKRGYNSVQAHEVTDYETALDKAGYGRFSTSALGACAIAFFTTGVENCVMSYVLPAARCELRLTTYQVGLVNMAFMCGGVASAFFWGIAGDVFGRRKTLSLTLILNGILTLAQSAVPDYRLLLAARSVNGFLIGGPSTLVLTYLSDLVGAKRRQLYLSITGMSFVAAWLILPALAWLVIPFKMVNYATLLPIYSWRLYLALNSLPGFVSGIWILLLPESPRFLCDTNRSEKALKLITHIYKVNNGKSSEFKVKKILSENAMPIKTITGDEESRTKTLFLNVLKDLKTFVSSSYAMKSSLILFVFFANMAAGFGLNLYIPEMLLRMQGRECKFSKINALSESTRLYKTLNTTWNELNKIIEVQTNPDFSRPFNETRADLLDNQTSNGCDPDMDSDIFTSGLIVGACCVLGNAACAFLCARGGACGVRRAAAACAFACALACGLLAASACSCSSNNKIAVASAAVLNAASLNGNVLLIRLLLLALPAKLSGLGVCWGAWWGRSGGVASNLAVGALLDFSCPAPFISVAALLAVSIGAIMMIKLQKNVEKSAESGTEDKTEQAIEKTMGLDRYISTHI